MDELFNNYWPENDYRYYLQHHGVKGQKWGVRNAEWYPIADYQAHLSRTGGKSKSVSSGRISNKQSGATSSLRVPDKKDFDKAANAFFLKNSNRNCKIFLERSLEAKKKGNRLERAENYKQYLFYANARDEFAQKAAEKLTKDPIEQYVLKNALIRQVNGKDGYAELPEILKKIDENREAIDTLEEACKDATTFTDIAFRSSEDKKRAKDAAELGLIALEKMRGPGYIDEEPYDFVDPITKKTEHVTTEERHKGNIEWFIYEDQTIGMATVADLVNRGYSAKKIGDAIDTVMQNADKVPYDLRRYLPHNDAITTIEIGDYYELKSFAKYCEQVKNEQSGKVSDSQSGFFDEAHKERRALTKEARQKNPNYVHSEQEREIAAKVKERGYSSLTAYEKKIYNKAYK